MLMMADSPGATVNVYSLCTVVSFSISFMVVDDSWIDDSNEKDVLVSTPLNLKPKESPTETEAVNWRDRVMDLVWPCRSK